MEKSQVVVLVACLYFATMIGTGFYAAKKNKSASDYLVAGRGVNVIMTAITLAAVQIGVGIVMGSATNGYSMGIWPGVYYAIGCGGGLILAGLIVVKRLYSATGYVPLDFYGQRYGESKWVRMWAWISNVPSLLGIFTAQMLACGSILAGFGVPFGWGVVICTAVVLVYCSVGGMWGVILTDVIQTTIIMVGVPIFAIAAIGAYTAAGHSVAAIFSTPFIPEGMFTKFIYLVLPFFLSIGVSYDAYMRIQSAKNAKTAAVGCIMGGIVVIIVGIMCSTIGVTASYLFPGVTDGIFVTAAVKILNPVMAGIVIAAVLSAAMSSANCVLVSMGASFARDFYNKCLHPDKELDELPYGKAISQWTVVVGAIVGALVAFKMTNILDAMIIFNYPYMGSLLVPLLGGILWKGATRKGAFAAIIVGGIVGVGAFLVGIPGPFQNMLNPDLGLFVAYLASAVVFVGVSLTDKSKQGSLASTK